MKKPTNTKKTVKKSLQNPSKGLANVDEQKKPAVKKPRGWAKSGKTEVGSGKTEDGSRKTEVESTKKEVAAPIKKVVINKKSVVSSEISNKKEFGSLKTEVGSEKTEDGSPKSEVESTKKEVAAPIKKLAVTKKSAVSSKISKEKSVDKPAENAPSTTDIPAEMLSYGSDLEKYITESPAVRIHGKFPKDQLDHMVNTAMKKYTYTVENDEFGSFITMDNKAGVKLRIPQTGYLPL